MNLTIVSWLSLTFISAEIVLIGIIEAANSDNWAYYLLLAAELISCELERTKNVFQNVIKVYDMPNI